MFRNGSRIVLLASSVSQTLGPKRYSIGYVINSSDNYLVVPNPTLPVFVASYVDIMFARYGKENKARCEYCGVLALCPAFNTEIAHGQPAKAYGKEVLKLLIKTATLRKDPSWTKTLADFTGKFRASIAVVAPALSYEAADMQTVPFVHMQAWAESLIRNNRFLLSCREWYNSGMYKVLGISEGLIRWIGDSHGSKKSKKDLFEWAASSPAARSEFIFALKKLDSVGHRRGLERHLSYFQRSLAKRSYLDFKGQMRFENYINILMQNFFEPQVLERKEVCIGEDENSAVLMDTTVGMRKIRDVMLSLVPKK